MASDALKGHLSIAGAYLIFGLNVVLCKDIANSQAVAPIVLFTLRALGASALFWLGSLFLPGETVDLRDLPKIAAASFLAMEAGADFIKTSTGKVEVNATPAAAYVMCECIKKFYEKTGRKVGFKAAGGISSAMDAVCYYSIVSTILGREWLGKGLFRFGVSRLANQLLSAIEKKTIVYF